MRRDTKGDGAQGREDTPTMSGRGGPRGARDLTRGRDTRRHHHHDEVPEYGPSPGSGWDAPTGLNRPGIATKERKEPL